MTDDYINKMWDRIIEEEQVVSIETEKGRVYVDDPSEAPDDVNVQEGQQGGYYYETGGGGESGSSGVDGTEQAGVEEALTDEEVAFDYHDNGEITAAVDSSDGIGQESLDQIRDSGYSADSLEVDGGNVDLELTQEDTTDASQQEVDMVSAEEAISSYPFDYQNDGNIVVQTQNMGGLGEAEVERMRRSGYEMSSVNDGGLVTFSPVGEQ
jgi:hypothetical protein